ncbi:protein-glutamate O-methyltransferase CheR [Vitiosangium sp. GDMCC 1.1324]|uniref:CheR family methyltransferase n=1 Tax=Vitiosangium sp. (strain GDMCC 1.1324) TaxID=2138576 RepID=UPI000D3D2B8E|nr:protein-glutamate O-methyltransferase [Vitiosangium sp. GDMCC 1.1324]PTL76432.1 chemotaxis protein CheR [Vitiosangium sp. GDMCC 1.1324]
MLGDREFSLFQELIYRHAGIHLSDAKKALLEGRLTRRLRELGLRSFTDYYRYVTQEEHEEERVRMLDCISTNETRFFREPSHFRLLEEQVIPRWLAQASAGRRDKRLRVWSAGCSTGEEPYSLAMLLLDHCSPSQGWEIEIVATDLSSRVLEQARAGLWPIQRAEEIPKCYLEAFMLKGVRSQAGLMKAGAALRSVVRFHRLNLNDEAYPVSGSFELIFCRNVLIYFDTRSKAATLKKLLRYLTPEGLFFLGHAESLSGFTDEVRGIHPTVYARRQAQSVYAPPEGTKRVGSPVG